MYNELLNVYDQGFRDLLILIEEYRQVFRKFPDNPIGDAMMCWCFLNCLPRDDYLSFIQEEQDGTIPEMLFGRAVRYARAQGLEPETNW